MPAVIRPFRAGALAVLGCLSGTILGCDGGTVARDDQAQIEIQRLKTQVVRLEDEVRRQSKKIDDLTARLTAPPPAPAPAAPAATATLLTPAAPAAHPAPAETSVAATKPPDVPDADPAARKDGDQGTHKPGPLAFDEFTVKVQRALKRAGYDPGPEDGKKGPQTTKALQAFQRENNVPQSGMADEATWALLKRYLE